MLVLFSLKTKIDLTLHIILHVIAALVQFMLRELSHHYDSIVGAPPDGVWGDASAQDIRALQRASALPETGEVDKKTWNALADAYSRAVRERDTRQK